MSIPLLGSEAAFKRFGHAIDSQNVLNTARGASTNTRIDLIFDDFLNTDQSVIAGVNGLYAQRDAFRLTGNTLHDYYQALTQATLIQMADDDSDLFPFTLENAIDRLNLG